MKLTKEQVQQIFDTKTPFTVKGSLALAYRVDNVNGAETVLEVLEALDQGEASVVYAPLMKDGVKQVERWITGEVERMLEEGEFVAYNADHTVFAGNKDAFSKIGQEICDLISHLDECESPGHMKICLNAANELFNRAVLMAKVKAKDMPVHPIEKLMNEVMSILKPRDN